MKYLLDTHAFLWFLEGSPKLNARAKAIILEKRNICFVSIASLWEITIKFGLQKLRLEVPFSDLEDEIKKNDFQTLPVTFDHLKELLNLENIHRDPFDRLIVAQAISENLTIISKDENFNKYKEVEVLW